MTNIFRGESLKRLLQGAVLGSIVTMVIGFSWFDWTLSSTAATQKAKAVEEAVVTVYTPVCVRQYNAGATPALRAKFAKESSWNRDSVIEESGFATLPGSETPNGALADACADALDKALEASKEAANKS